MALILASGSPRRRELLGLITNDFTVCVSNAEEETDPSLSPADTVLALARVKGEAVARTHPDDTVIAADTVVALNGKILGKPTDAAEARRMLYFLSGKTHAVFTGVYIASRGRERCFYEKTDVTFYPLSDREIDAYVRTGEPFDKAGAYGIQGKGSLLVKGIAGDYFNVVGFPVAGVYRALRELEENHT